LRSVGSRPRPRREQRCSRSSKASTIRAAVTHRSGISRRSTTSIGIGQWHRSRPASACRRARHRQGQALRAAPKTVPALTAAARDGRTGMRAGTKEWLRRGPNQRMVANRRTKCGAITWPDPARAIPVGLGSSAMPKPLHWLAVQRASPPCRNGLQDCRSAG
jgi:hypothetical protein